MNSLDAAVQVGRANLAFSRGCLDTQQAFLDLACAIDIGATTEQIVALSDYANLMSAKERAADIFERDDFSRENWLRQADEITRKRDDVILRLRIR